MAVAIRINGAAAGPNLDLPIDTAVTLTNTNNAGVTTWLWEILDKPPGSTAALTSASTSSTQFTPDVEGSYLIALTTNAGLVDESYGRQVAAVLQIRTRIRIPSFSEEREADPAPGDGWATSVNAILRLLDRYAADPARFVAVNASGGTRAPGDLVRISSVVSVLTGLPGATLLPSFEVADATTAADALSALYLVESVIGGGVGGVTDTSLAVLRRSGMAIVTGTEVAGTRLYLSDAGLLSATPGTFQRELGASIYTSGGQMWVHFDGSLVPSTLQVASLIAPLVGTVANVAAQFRANSVTAWEIDPTTRAWQAVGANRPVRNVADPTTDDDALPLLYADMAYGPPAFVFGVGTVLANTNTNILPPGYDPGNSGVDEIYIPIPSAIEVVSIFIHAAGGGPVGDTTVFSARRNGTDVLQATLAIGSTNASNTVASGSGIPFALADKLSVSAVSGAGITTGPKRVVVTVGYRVRG